MKKKNLALLLGLTLTLAQLSPAAALAEQAASDTAQEGIQQAGMPDGQTSPDMQNGSGGVDGGPGEPPSGERPELPPDAQGGSDEMNGGPGGEPPAGERPDMPGGQGGPGGMSSGVDSYSAVNTYEEDAQVSAETILSTGTDENALLVDGADASVTVSDCVITRESDESTGGDTSSFYGVGAALLAANGSLTITGSEITTDAAGGAGVFAYGDGVVYVSDTTIHTLQGTSGGIHAAGGGTVYASNLDVETEGGSSAAIRSDRGGGTMVVDGGTYTSNGSGSPAIYCTADISVHDAALTATGSEAVCIEGLNTIRLFDCDLAGSMPDQEQNDISWNVIVYQSMSGDSVEGNGTFEMVGGTLTAGNGGMFYTTNTESTITLQDVDITSAQDNPFFLQVTGNTNQRGWGSAGSNGADCLFTAISQDMEGNVIWDSISTLDFYMTDNSALTGAFVNDETYAGEGGDGTCTLIIDETSTWIVTGNSAVTSLQNAGTIVDENNETVSIVSTDGTVFVEGSSPYTVTTGSYSGTADVTGASVPSVWEDVAGQLS